jgi:hypothetical protein
MKPRVPVELVSWLDASDAFASWTRASKASAEEALVLVQSVGYVVDVSDEILTLATSVTESDGEIVYGGGIHIPYEMVRRRRRLS